MKRSEFLKAFETKVKEVGDSISTDQLVTIAEECGMNPPGYMPIGFDELLDMWEPENEE
jgi:hypothetical protein